MKDAISSLTKVEDRIEEAYFFTMISLKTSNNLEDIEPEFFWKDKTFENPEIEKLVRVGSSCLKKSAIGGHEENEIEGLVKVFEGVAAPSLFIADVYFLYAYYQEAVNLYEKYIQIERESHELRFYTIALEKLNIGSSKLMFLLEKWRKNYGYDEQLLRLEADLYKAALNWEKCIEISDYVLKNDPRNDAFLVLNIIAADGLDNKELLDSAVAGYLQIETYELDKMPAVIETLNRRFFLDEAVDILYRCIERDKDNSLLLMLYMHTCLIYSNQKKDKFKDFEQVQEKCFIKYQINNNIRFKEIKKGDGAGMFENKKVGDTFTHGSYTISILRIMDQYLYLHDRILQNVSEMPPELSGLPMESISMDPSNPQIFLEMVKERFGEDETHREEVAQKLLDGYYNREVSYTEIVMNLCKGDYLAGYFYLASVRSGIVIIPAAFFKQFEYEENPPYIIDLSTLPILFQIANKYKVTYPQKPYISKYLVEMLKRTLHKLQTEPTSTLSVVVTKEDVTKIETSPKAKENDVVYLTKLIEWVKENCIEVVEPDSLDLKRALHEEDICTQYFADYLVNTCAFSSNKKAIIVTDDTLYAKFNFVPINYCVSSEIFIKETLGEEHLALNEFIQNRYIGYSPTFRQLKNEFDLNLKGDENSYEFCIKNINPGIFSVLIELLVYIIRHQDLSDERKSEETEFVISSLFQSINDQKIIGGFCALINLKCSELLEDESVILIDATNKVLNRFTLQ